MAAAAAMIAPKLPPAADALVVDTAPTGSRAICDPPPTDTDEDWLLFVPESAFDAFSGHLDADGWDEANGSEVEPMTDDDQRGGSEFTSFAKQCGDRVVNLIVTRKGEFFRRFAAATSVARRLNLLDKSDRIALFQAVLYGNPATMRAEGSPAAV